MDHKTQIHFVPGSETAVLLVHGILGTPHQFDFLIPSIPADWTTINLLLDGHGGSVEDFGRSSMKKWENQVADCVENLCAAHRNVFIVAHSMGTLFAIDAALAHPDQIKGLFLLSPPLRIGIKPRLFRSSLKVGLGFACDNDREAMAAKRAYSIASDRRIWKYWRWIPRYMELFQKIHTTRNHLPHLSTPTRAFLCEKDEMVSIRTDRSLAVCSQAEIFYLPNSTHFTYSTEDARQIVQSFSELNRLI